MITQKTLINSVLVYLLLFISGSWRYNLSPNKFLVVGFSIALVAWYLFSDRKFNDRFLIYVVVFTGFLFSLNLYTGGGITLGSVISAAMKLTVAYLILKTVGKQFLETYIKVVVLLAVISLFGYLTDRFNLFDGLIRRLPPVEDLGYEGILYLFRFRWHIERNNSIFFEPGAYQAFLNAALFLIFFAKTSFNNSRKLIYIAILVITLVTTFSTTGFIIFLAMTPFILIRSKVLTFNQKITVVVVFIAGVSVFAAQFYETFVVKINDYLSAQEYEILDSATGRSGDARTDLKIFRKHIFGLGYDEYIKEFHLFSRRRADQLGSSNGVTRTLAILGLPFSLFLFGSYYWALRRLLADYQLSVTAWAMVMLFFAGESYYVITPVTCAIIAAAFVFVRSPVKNELRHQARDLPN